MTTGFFPQTDTNEISLSLAAMLHVFANFLHRLRLIESLNCELKVFDL